MGPVDIAKALHCTRANAGPLVDRLVEKGWFTKERSPLDARMLTVRVTERGREAYRLLIEHIDAVVEGLFAELNDDEKEALLDLFWKITGRYADS